MNEPDPKKETHNQMKLWNAVQKTDPKYTKDVAFGRKFTAINAQYQIMEATKTWGPMGHRWWIESEIIKESPNVIIKVILYYPTPIILNDDCKINELKRPNIPEYFGKVHQYGGCRNADKDDDAFKKALTDGTTKCLSLLGFNADIFLGMWEDNKYVEDLKQEKTTMAPSADLDKAKKQAYRMSKKLPDKRRVFCEEIFEKMPKTLDNILVMPQLSEAFTLINDLPQDRQQRCEDFVTCIDIKLPGFDLEVKKALSMIKAVIEDLKDVA